METYQVLGLLVLFIIISGWHAVWSLKQVRVVRENYEKALNELKNDPLNTSLKQNALDIGREYSQLNKRLKTKENVNEITLMNDIDAVSISHSMVNTELDFKKMIEDRLILLFSLLEKGLITQEEYQERKKKVLKYI